MIEAVVHSDDLAYSLGIEMPSFVPDVVDLVMAALLGVARQRHGDIAVIRAFARGERATATSDVTNGRARTSAESARSRLVSSEAGNMSCAARAASRTRRSSRGISSSRPSAGAQVIGSGMTIGG